MFTEPTGEGLVCQSDQAGVVCLCECDDLFGCLPLLNTEVPENCPLLLCCSAVDTYNAGSDVLHRKNIILSVGFCGSLYNFFFIFLCLNTVLRQIHQLLVQL